LKAVGRDPTLSDQDAVPKHFNIVGKRSPSTIS
jgi:hypothetical protein